MQGPVNLVRDATCWQCEHEWRQDLAVVTKWLSGTPQYHWLPSNSTSNSKPIFEEKYLSFQPQTSARWPNFLCICSVFSSGSVQLHWSQWPTTQNDAHPKWFSTSKGLLGAGPSGIMAADAIVTEAGTLHVAGVPIVNPSTVVVWEVTPGPGSNFQAIIRANTNNGVPPSLNPPSWVGFAPLAAYLFSWQELLGAKHKKLCVQDMEPDDPVSLHCLPVSNFSAYVSPEAAAQSTATTTWGSSVISVAFDPTQGGAVIAVVIVEGQYMSPYDPDEGPSITGWRIQRWESSCQPVVLHPVFGNPSSSLSGQSPMQPVWLMKVNKTIKSLADVKGLYTSAAAEMLSDVRNLTDPTLGKTKKHGFDYYDVPSDIRMLADIVFSSHGGEVAVALLHGEVHLFSGANFSPVDSFLVNVGFSVAAPAFSSSSCCLASVWHDMDAEHTLLKIMRVIPSCINSSQGKVGSEFWERAIADSQYRSDRCWDLEN
ncbi:Mediator of RNA polymerase II transcription subunit 16 [Nymphaea thermarum]|nr:Mediator of RNA polymerase II transcription subunit 16 [Nymphaea thermarum]